MDENSKTSTKSQTEKESSSLGELGILAVASSLVGCDDKYYEGDSEPVRTSGVYQSSQSSTGDGSGASVNSSDSLSSSGSVNVSDYAHPQNAGVNSSVDGTTQGVNNVQVNSDVRPLTAPPPRFNSLQPIANQIGLSTTMMGVNQTMSDGAILPVWSFLSAAGSGFNGDRIAPAPCIEVIQGATIELQLTSMMPHTIHLHGLDVDQANDGVPATSGVVASPMPPMPMPMPNPIPIPAGINVLPSPFTYVFNASHAGTYMYHCHFDTVLHMEMGMSGTIIVRPPDGNQNLLWTGGPSYDREYVWHLHTFDSSWHSFTQSGVGTSRYQPNYFMINGRDGLGLISDPVTALHALAGETVLIRAVNIGYQPASISLGGIMFRVMASDGRPLAQTVEVNEFVVAPGERYDILFTMPVATNGMATVQYFNIMGSAVLGTATTSITSY